jgi:sialidase-1
MLNMRANDNRFRKEPDNRRAVAITKDVGATCKAHPTSRMLLPEPVCMASINKHSYA